MRAVAGRRVTAALQADAAPDPLLAPIPAIAEDGSLYPIGKLRAHELGVLHLAISVFLFDETGALLLQRRALGKYHCGGLWANTVCTHPHLGESNADCAVRRLREELGIAPAPPLTEKRTIEYEADVGGGLREHERVTVFAATVERGALGMRPNPDEVMDTRWVTRGALIGEAAETPEHFTPWLRIYLSKLGELGL